MEAAVTRREMYEALEVWSGAIISKLTETFTVAIGELRNELRNELRTELRTGLGSLRTEMANMERSLRSEMANMEGRLMAELQRHTSASTEELTGRINVVDEQYRDLPPRVAKLEAKVFAPKRRRTR